MIPDKEITEDTQVIMRNPLDHDYQIVYGNKVVQTLKPGQKKIVPWKHFQLAHKYIVDELITLNEVGWVEKNGERVKGDGFTQIIDDGIRAKYYPKVFVGWFDGDLDEIAEVKSDDSEKSTQEDGFDELTEEDELFAKTKSELLALAAKEGVEVAPNATKPQLVQAILER